MGYFMLLQVVYKKLGITTVKRGSSLQAKNNPQIYANPRELVLD